MVVVMEDELCLLMPLVTSSLKRHGVEVGGIWKGSDSGIDPCDLVREVARGGQDGKLESGGGVKVKARTCEGA